MAKQEGVAPLSLPRLVSGAAALHYLGGERPERFGVQPIKGKRHRLYDRRAIDVALDRIASLEMAQEESNSPQDALVALVEEWR